MEFLSHTGTMDITAGAFSLLRLLEHLPSDVIITPKRIALVINDFAERCGGKYIQPRRDKDKKHIKPNRDNVTGNKFRLQLLELESVGLVKIIYFKDEKNKTLPSGYKINIDHEILVQLASGELRPEKKLKDDSGKSIRKKITYHSDLAVVDFFPSGKHYLNPPKLEANILDKAVVEKSTTGKQPITPPKLHEKIPKVPVVEKSTTGNRAFSDHSKSEQTVDTVGPDEVLTSHNFAVDASRIYNTSNINNNNPPNPPSDQNYPLKINPDVVGALKSLILDSKLKMQFNAGTYSKLKKIGLNDGQIKTLINEMNQSKNIKSCGWLLYRASTEGAEHVDDADKIKIKEAEFLEARANFKPGCKAFFKGKEYIIGEGFEIYTEEGVFFAAQLERMVKNGKIRLES